MLNGFVQFVLGRSASTEQEQPMSTSAGSPPQSSVLTENTDDIHMVDGVTDLHDETIDGDDNDEWILVNESQGSVSETESASVVLLNDPLTTSAASSLAAGFLTENLPPATTVAAAVPKETGSRKANKHAKGRPTVSTPVRRSTRVRTTQALLVDSVAGGAVMRAGNHFHADGGKGKRPHAPSSFPPEIRSRSPLLTGGQAPKSRNGKIKQRGFSGSNNDRKNQYY